MTLILVTGSAKGLGREIALELASKGHSIIVHYRNSEKEATEVAIAAEQFGVSSHVIQGDFSDNASLEDFLTRLSPFFPEISGLVNNVGNYLIAPATATSLQEWQDLLQTNLLAPIALTKALIPSLKSYRGAIVNLGVTGLHTMRANSYATAYSITKQGLYSLTLALAKELAPDFVRVNMVSPGYLETSVDLKDPHALPMQRAGTLKEVARLVAFLFDEENRYITGQNIEVAGAFML